MNFELFKIAVQKQFKRMEAHQLYRTQADKTNIWENYLVSFPAGTNLKYKERNEYDCNCCKNFIRNVGNVVAIIDGKMESIWDISVDEPNFQVVTDALSKLVKSYAIENHFYHFEKTAGTDKNHFKIGDVVNTWHHFFVNIPNQYVKKQDEIPTLLGKSREDYNVFKRSLSELTVDSVETVLELIAQNSLYRGEEQKYALTEFLKYKKAYEKTGNKDTFIWEIISDNTVAQSVIRIRNTAIGSLLVDLSEDVELEDAVKSFESKVAPSNYKRTNSLITKSMIDAAKIKVEELGLTSALGRRYAKLDDITVNNILFANRESLKVIDKNVFDMLASNTAEKPKVFDKTEEISIEKFISDVLPKADSIEVLFENRHSGNLFSLIAPTDSTAGNLFKWNNNFSWSYAGEVTDSIKERVKNAGGQVDGDLCCRLAWDYEDDLDFIMVEPSGNKIYFGNRRTKSVNGGMLDVDANGIDGIMEFPVENIFYKNKSTMKEGVYKLKVNNYNRRSAGTGFEIEIDALGQVYNMSYDKSLRSGETMDVAEIYYTKAEGFKVFTKLVMKKSSKEIWGIGSEQFHKVNLMMLSPNHWDEQVNGNKHYFFVLDKCNNPESSRGFYNEFLRNELNVHRKVFEVLGSSLKTEESNTQLSGLGFSSTQSNEVIVRVKGNFTRNLRIKFN